MNHLHHADSGSPQSVFFTLILVFTVVIYLRGWLSLRSGAKTRNSIGRPISFSIGLLLVWISVASPFAALDHELLTVHMVQHLLLMTLAPPLILMSAPTLPLLHGLPRQFVENVLIPVRYAGAGKRSGNVMARLTFAWLAACAALVGWHIPTLFALGMQSTSWHLFEELSFLATGLLFWLPVVRPSAGASRQDLSIVVYLFFATLPCDILSGFLVFSDRVVYPIYLSSTHLWGFSPLIDQQCAAALMWTCVTVVYLVAGAILTMRLLSPLSLPKVECIEPKWQTTEIGRRVPQSLEAL